MNFKQYLILQENELVKELSSYLGYNLEVRKETSRTITVVIKSKDRETTRDEVQDKLGDKYEHTWKRSGGSIGTTVVKMPGIKVDILYKPVSGGMSETTLNSTITELAPALAFANNKKFNSVNKFWEWLQTLSENDHKSQSVYVNSKDALAGAKYTGIFDQSSKFQEKMENAIGVLKYLYDLNKEKTISNVYWGYRAKPKGIPSSHKGDLFVDFGDSMIGVSLKAGGKKTSEPQLNTYVKPVIEKIAKSADKELKALDKLVYDNVHKNLGLPRDWKDRKNYKKSVDTLVTLEKTDNKKYEENYDLMLAITKDYLIDLFNQSKTGTLRFIQNAIVGSDENVPLVVVKAIGTSYEFVEDGNILEKMLPFVNRVKAVPSRSKQEFIIQLDKVGLKMSIRTNKSKPDNKLQQGWNLAVKFNGLTK